MSHFPCFCSQTLPTSPAMTARDRRKVEGWCSYITITSKLLNICEGRRNATEVSHYEDKVYLGTKVACNFSLWSHLKWKYECLVQTKERHGGLCVLLNLRWNKAITERIPGVIISIGTIKQMRGRNVNTETSVSAVWKLSVLSSHTSFVTLIIAGPATAVVTSPLRANCCDNLQHFLSLQAEEITSSATLSHTVK